MGKNYYETLQVSRDAEDAVIRASYKALVQKYHPDKYQPREDAERLTAALNEAYAYLSDPQLRKAHDDFLDAQEKREYAPPPPPPAAESTAKKGSEPENSRGSGILTWLSQTLHLGTGVATIFAILIAALVIRVGGELLIRAGGELLHKSTQPSYSTQQTPSQPKIELDFVDPFASSPAPAVYSDSAVPTGRPYYSNDANSGITLTPVEGNPFAPAQAPTRMFSSSPPSMDAEPIYYSSNEASRPMQVQPPTYRTDPIQFDEAQPYSPPAPSRTIYADTRGREVMDARPAGPNAYWDNDGQYHSTFDRGDGVQQTYKRPIDEFNRVGNALK